MMQLERDLQQMVVTDAQEQFSSVLDVLRPEVLSSHKHAIQYQVFQDQYTWSACGRAVGPNDTSLIQLTQKGIIDLEASSINFKFEATNCGMLLGSDVWEVQSYSIGNVNMSQNYQFNIQQYLNHNMGLEKIMSHQGLRFDPLAKPVDVAGYAASIGNVGSSSLSVPFTALIPQLKGIKHLFVGMGQHFLINMRTRAVTDLVCTGAPNFVISNCSVVLKYVQLSDDDLNQIIKNKIYFPLETFTAVPQETASSMTFQLPVSQKDKVRGLLFALKLKASAHATAVADNNLIGTATKISGFISPSIPIQRIAISYGQQNIVLDQNQLKNLNICSFAPHSNILLSREHRAMFDPFYLDLTRFGINDDPHGSEQGATSLLVTIDLDTTPTLGPLFATANAFAIGTGTQVYGYLITNRNFVLENGIYRQQ